MKTYRPELEARYEFLLLSGHAKKLKELHQQLGYSSELETDPARNNSEAIANAIASSNFDNFTDLLCAGVPLSGNEFSKFFFHTEAVLKQEKFLAALWTHPTISHNIKLISEIWYLVYIAKNTSLMEKFLKALSNNGAFTITDLLQNNGKSGGLLNTLIFDLHAKDCADLIKLILSHLKYCSKFDPAIGITPLEIELTHTENGYTPLQDAVRYNYPNAVRMILEAASDSPKILKEILGAKTLHQGKNVTAIGMLAIIPKREVNQEDIDQFAARGVDYSKVLEIKSMLVEYQKMVDDLERTLAATSTTNPNTSLASAAVPAAPTPSAEVSFYDTVQAQQHSARARLTNSDGELFHFFETF